MNDHAPSPENRAAAVLRTGEAPFRAVFEAMDEGACLIERLPVRPDGRRDYRYIAMNQAMRTMFGIADLTGQTIRDNFPDEVEAWYDDYDRVLDTGHPLRFERESEPQGVVLEMFVTRLEDAAGRHLLVVMRDVTARTRAETALQHSQARHTFLLSLADRIRPLSDPADIMTVASEAVGRFLGVGRCGYGEVDASGHLFTVERDWTDGVMPTMAGTVRLEHFGVAVSEAHHAGLPLAIDDAVHDARSRASAAAFDAIGGVRASLSVPLVKHGRWVAALFVHQASPRQWTTDDETLVRDVAERTWTAVERARAEAALRASDEQLRDADRRKDEFLAMLAHELRNPLAPIRTGLELIRMGGNTPAAVEQVRSIMDRQVGHMVRLIDDLLDVSRITSGKIQLQREPAPLSGLVHSAVDANRAPIAAKNITLTVDLPETACVLDVDPTRFVQVISNVLHNAMKFTKPGGTIHVGAHVSEAPEPALREVTLTVSDSGIGISPELLPRMFDMFVQGAGSDAQPGLGIGLALARRLLEMQGGTIVVRSDGPGRGSTFAIRMPVSMQSSRPAPAETGGSRVFECRVLVIDDNRDAANAMAMLLTALGAECRTAYDGESGLQEALTSTPEIIFLDIGMPGIDGYETCRRLRQTVGHDVSIVALTGFGKEQDKALGRAAGFDAHLTKPVDPSALDALFRERRCQSATTSTSTSPHLRTKD